MTRRYSFGVLGMVVIAAALTLGLHGLAAAHCDTLDGPVVQDAQVALKARDVTPVLKWVPPADEKAVKDAFAAALAAREKKEQDAAEKKFFETLVRIHRAGEGAPFTGIKPAGEVDPAVAAADRSLAGGSSDQLVEGLTNAITQGIRTRYDKVAEALRHKDESVQKGREFVAAYIEYTHYVEGVHKAIMGAPAHGGDAEHEHAEPEPKHGH